MDKYLIVCINRTTYEASTLGPYDSADEAQRRADTYYNNGRYQAVVVGMR